MRAAVEPSVVERSDGGEKEKKKRRSNRRSKQASASSGALLLHLCTSVPFFFWVMFSSYN